MVITTVEANGAIALVAGPLESWPVATGSLGTGLSGVVTLVAGRCVGLGEFVVIWPTGTTLKATRARLALTSDRKSLRLGATIHAGRELAGLTEADQIELARLIPSQCVDMQVVVLGDWRRAWLPAHFWSSPS